MSIEWREAMAVGVESIDDDHKHLVELINQFEVAIAEGETKNKSLSRVILGLVEYTSEHFAREEALQLEIRYPYYDSHKKAHRELLKKLAELVAQYVSCHDIPKREKLIRGLADFLKEWLVEHIIQSDLRMKPYFVQYNREKAVQDQLRAKARRTAAILESHQA